MTDGTAETKGLGFEVGGDHQDELFEVLAHARRRFTIQYLQTVETPLTVDELTTELVAWEDRRTEGDQSRDDRTGIRISLVHSHLPKMADAGVVTYEATRQTVMFTDGADKVDTHLQAMTRDKDGAK